MNSGVEQFLYIYSESDVPVAMRATRQMAESMGFNAVEIGYLATVATELASNLWIHAGGGVFGMRILPESNCLELSTSDTGPGIEDITLALQDGYSTAGGLGCGLPGVQRLMDGLEIDTSPKNGTRIRTWKMRKI